MQASKINLRILVVDDEDFILNLIQMTLLYIGYASVEIVNTGSEAIRRLKSGRKFDIIICDLCMPNLDGVEFIRKANDGGYVGGLILLSGESGRVLSSAVNLAKKYKLNIIGALRKPIEKNLLEDMIGSYQEKDKITGNTFVSSIKPEELEEGLNLGENGPLEMFYQPKINIRSGAITGVEALARWRHETRGLLAPFAFIPLAERTGLVDKLTRVAFRQAVSQAVRWHKSGQSLVTAINFSVNSFAGPGLINYIFDVMNEFDADPKLINIEVTETQTMLRETECLENLIRLRLHHFGLSIDDFGTGNSTLARLKKIPFTELKIDREFVNGTSGNAEARTMLESSISLAKKLGMQAVAEGAETQEDWDLVAKLGCDFVQGYYCGAPMAVEEFNKFLLDWDGPKFNGFVIEKLSQHRSNVNVGNSGDSLLNSVPGAVYSIP